MFNKMIWRISKFKPLEAILSKSSRQPIWSKFFTLFCRLICCTVNFSGALKRHQLSKLWTNQNGVECAITINYCTYTNHVGVSPRALHCVADTSYGLGRSLGHCRPALLKGRKYQMVKTQTESHIRRPVV